MDNKEYFIGLDIGTDSVGWAVTDTAYHILKVHGKALWGVRLFDAAQAKDDRRMHRVSRRRIERTKQRIEWLEEEFGEEIAKADPGFYQRLRESKFLEEDKLDAQGRPIQSRFSLFADKEFCDIDYYHAYPTVYHLRHALMTQKKKFDIRLVYLAVHHILKYRGHFLFEDDLGLEQNAEGMTFAKSREDFERYYEEQYEGHLPLGDEAAFENCLIDRSLGVKKKTEKLASIAGIMKKDRQNYAVLRVLSGEKVKLNELFAEDVAEKGAETDSVSFKDGFEGNESKLQSVLGDKMEMIYALKKIYDFALLGQILNGAQTISEAKIATYAQHKENLAQMKAIVRSLGRKEYKAIFCDRDQHNYPAYTGHACQGKRCSYEEFSKYTIKILKPYEKKADVACLIEKLKDENYLPLQTGSDNGVIPHQLHGAELKQILANASAYYPFLNAKDESGLTLSERIQKMFSFRLPYYAGPLDTRSEYSWIVRNSNEKVMPWNFERVVDLSETAKAFITRMTARCTYTGADVLPKDSLLYSRFMVLNELNNIEADDKRLPVEVKQAIFNDLFIHGRKNKVTLNDVKAYLIREGLIKKNAEISGVDVTFKATLTSRKDFDGMLRRGLSEEDAEEIIRRIVLFGEDKKLLSSWLREEMGDKLSKAEQKDILRFKYSGWGNLSREFLTEIKQVDEETGELISIINAMWMTQNNLMELLSGRYQYMNEAIKWREKETAARYHGRKMTLDDYLDDNYAAPGIRRAIHQTIGIINELEKIMSHAPKRIFVEVAREEGEKKRTVTRKDQLMDLYKRCGEEVRQLAESLSQKTDGELRRDKLYLYYVQKGKCMYSGEPIELSRLDSGYDIDHIWPQKYIKDDSIENRVLVKQELNREKSANYPLSTEIRSRMQLFWKELHAQGLIGDKKYDRLTRNSELSMEEKSSFIARQLVETRQSTKLIAHLLESRYGDGTEVVYVKAGNVSSFRQDQRIDKNGQQRQAWDCRNEHTQQDPVFVKCREVNDLHHAKDAYLNIVVGNVYHVKFTRNPANFFRENTEYSLNRMFDYDVMRGGESAWTRGPEGSIAVVRQMMRKNNILFTRYAHRAKGGFYDQQLMPKGKGQAPVKATDPRMTIDKFGGYNKLTGAFFFLVEHEDKKIVRSIEAVYLMHQQFYKEDPIGYCEKVLELKNPRILVPEIKIDSLISYDGFRMHVSGRTGSQIIYKNANQLVIAPEWQQYVKGLSKYLTRCREARTELTVTSHDGITREANMALYDLLTEKMKTGKYKVKMETPQKTLSENRNRFTGLSIYEQGMVIMQIINIFACNSASGDLKLLCGKLGIGILLTSKNYTNYEGHSVKLINQSITGVFEKEIDLLQDARLF